VLGAVVVARDTAEQKMGWLSCEKANKELAVQNSEIREKGRRVNNCKTKNLLFKTMRRKNGADEPIHCQQGTRISKPARKKNGRPSWSLLTKKLEFQNKEKKKREIANKELKAFSNSEKLASQYARSLIEASLDPLFTINPKGKDHRYE